MYTYVFEYFFNSMCEKKKKKMYICIFGRFSNSLKEKKSAQKVQQKRIWATAQLYCEKKKLYCNLAIVLQERELEKKIVLELYCKKRV